MWLLFASRIVQGAGGGTTGVAQAYVADTVEPKDRARALGWLSSATAAGVILGPAIGSFAFALGPAAPGLVAAGLCLVNVVFAWKWLPESRAGAAARRREPAEADLASRLAGPAAPDEPRLAADLDLRHRDDRLLGDDLGAVAVSAGRSSA